MKTKLTKLKDFLHRNLRLKIVLIALFIGVFFSVLGMSYAFFVISQEKSNVFNIVVGNLVYKLTSNKLDSSMAVTVPANTPLSFEVTIESLNSIDSKFQLYYQSGLPARVTVNYVEGTGDTGGRIGITGNQKKVTIVIINNSNTSCTVTFGVQGGFTTKELVLASGRIGVTEKFSYNKEYGYTGNYQTFITPTSGYYHFGAWGAAGGSSQTSTYGKGGYSEGTIYLEAGEKLYFYIGKQYAWGDTTTEKVFNGGGWSYRDPNAGNNKGSYGGGATDIRLISGEWDNAQSLASRILVAGGGGASEWDSTYGGNGGLLGTKGYGYSQGTAIGGSQVSGGSVANVTDGISGSFGKAGFYNGNRDLGGGGGGGYYGGGTPMLAGGGGGGSSFISGYAGVNAIQSVSSITPSNQTIHYSQKYFLDGHMYTGISDGSGKIKVSYVGLSLPRKNTKLDQVRYIKDCINGNTVTANNHWVEIQAIKDGVNVALNKTVTGTVAEKTGYPYSKIVDGNIDTENYGSSSVNGLQCVTIDLGQVYQLDEIRVWHYHGDYRKYNSHTVSVSSNQSTWDSIILNKNHVETENGVHFNAWQDGTDRSDPVITLKGDSVVRIEKGTAYVEPGYTVKDNVDANLSDKVEVYGYVNYNKEGTYQLLYVARDSSGNIGSATRQVVVHKEYTLRNLVKNGSFESNFTSWTKYGKESLLINDTNFHVEGTKSYGRNASSIQAEGYIGQNITLTQNHVYFMSFYGHANGSTGSTQIQRIYVDFAYVAGSAIIGSLAPGAVSQFHNRFTYTGATKAISLNVNWGVTTIPTYVDTLMIIDLTATFGSGNEPTLEWCKNNIKKWFDTTTTVDYAGS